MYSHFNVILLCFSSVYCISSKIDSLDLKGLKQILNDETTFKEWGAAIDQDIIYKDDNGSEKTVNVKHAVEDFVKKADNSDVTEFKKIRNIIKTAYQCTLMKYASLIAYLIVHDVRTLIAEITESLNRMRRYQLLFDRESIFKNLTLQDYIRRRVNGKQYHIDFDLKFRGRTIQILHFHEFYGTPLEEWQNVWADMIEKNLGFKIKYKIYPDVFRRNFTNELDLPDVDALNEIVCVLNEAIKMFDNFIVEKCIKHGGSFLNNFRSLEKGVNNNVILLTNYIDKKIAEKSSNWELYRDFSIPGPGTSQAVDNIMGSGGFVNNVEFEISGLKMDLENIKNPTDIYGHHTNERTSETVLKCTRTFPHETHVVNVGLVSFRDNEGLLADQQSPRRHVTPFSFGMLRPLQFGF